MKKIFRTLNSGDSPKRKDTTESQRGDSSTTSDNNDILRREAELKRREAELEKIQTKIGKKIDYVIKHQKEINKRIDDIVETTTNLSQTSHHEMDPYQGGGIYDNYNPQVREEVKSRRPAFLKQLQANEKDIEDAQKVQKKLIEKQVKLIGKNEKLIKQITEVNDDQNANTASSSSAKY